MKSASFRIDGEDCEVPDAFYRISIKLIIKNDKGELLVLRALNDGRHELPGGGLDWGETHEQAARRELEEELHLKLISIDPEPLTSEYGLNPLGFHTIKIYYAVQYTGTPIDNEPDLFTHSWVSKKAFIELDMPDDESPIKKHTDKIWS